MANLDQNSLNDSSLFNIFESENFEKLKELQQNNERQAVVKYFIDKLTKIYKKLFTIHESDEKQTDILSACKTKLYDVIVTTGDYIICKSLSYGGYSTVYNGTYKFLDVAIKKIGLSLLTFKQLVILRAIDFE